MLRKIAYWQQEGLITICPKKIISVAEVLEDIDRDFISATFKQTVHQSLPMYRRFSCYNLQAGTLHINEDLVHIEKNT